MTPSRPYLVRAMYQWIVDNGLTPHLLVDASSDTVEVPRQYMEDGKIVLNIGPMAVEALTLGNEDISFNARFNGEPMSVRVPVQYVLAIYTRENGQGMMFGDDNDDPPPDPDDATPARPRLKLVK